MFTKLMNWLHGRRDAHIHDIFDSAAHMFSSLKDALERYARAAEARVAELEQEIAAKVRVEAEHINALDRGRTLLANIEKFMSEKL